MSTGPEEELRKFAARMRGDDAVAFNAWVSGTYARVFRLAARLLHFAEDAEDVVQETYIRAYRNRASLREPHRHWPWLFRITRHTAIDRIRHNSRQSDRLAFRDDSPHDVEQQPSSHADPEQMAERAMIRARLHRAMMKLSDKHRTILLLREVDDCSYEEIAAMLGIPRGTVESRLYRAKRSLNRALRRQER